LIAHGKAGMMNLIDAKVKDATISAVKCKQAQIIANSQFYS